MDFSALGYELVHHGPGRWNGVAIASRIGISDVVAGIPTPDGWTDDGGRFLAATCGPMRVATIYVPNGRVVDSEFYLEKLEWLARLSVWLNDSDPDDRAGDLRRLQRRARGRRRLGSLNAVHGATHVSPRERPRSRSCGSGGWSTSCASSTPSRASSAGGTTAPGTSTRTSGCGSTTSTLSPPLAARAIAAERDRDARKPSTYPGIPSDHAPLIVDFADR